MIQQDQRSSLRENLYSWNPGFCHPQWWGFLQILQSSNSDQFWESSNRSASLSGAWKMLCSTQAPRSSRTEADSARRRWYTWNPHRQHVVHQLLRCPGWDLDMPYVGWRGSYWAIQIFRIEMARLERGERKMLHDYVKLRMPQDGWKFQP